MKKEGIYTMKYTNVFRDNWYEETKLSFNLPSGITSDMIFQIINHGNLCKDSSREYMLANTRKEITMKIHDYWKDHSEILYPRSSRSYMWLYYNEIARKRLRTLQEENIKQLSYMIYMMNKTKKEEMERWSIQLSRQITQIKRKDRWKTKREKRWASANTEFFRWVSVSDRNKK